MKQSLANADGVTQLLHAWNRGNLEALERLMPLVYSELRRLARVRFAGEGPGHTLQPTALVNEVYIRLARSSSPSWLDRQHFLAFAGAMMRSILVDHARRKKASKRGGGQATVCLADDEQAAQAAEPVADLLALDEALRSLERLEPRQARIVELRYFAGLTLEETAALLEISVSTVKDDWRMARSWLYRELTRARPDG